MGTERFSVRWWRRGDCTTVPITERFDVLDWALARGEQLWMTEALKVQVLIDGHDVAWEQPID